jgi:hypothetical protein
VGIALLDPSQKLLSTALPAGSHTQRPEPGSFITASRNAADDCKSNQAGDEELVPEAALLVQFLPHGVRE